MLAPTELSFDEILKFMLAHNGKVTNHELVKHFKVFLMNPDMKDEARSTFKKHVNTLANIKNQNNEKWLILKKKYVTGNNKNTDNSTESKTSESSNVTQDNISVEPMPPRPPLPLQLNQDFSILNNLIQNHPSGNSFHNDSDQLIPSVSKESLASVPSISSDDAPPVAPRRRSSDKHIDKQPSVPNMLSPRFLIPSRDISENCDESQSFLTPSKSESVLNDNEQKISVKERKQMFNRMASEGDVLKPHMLSNLNNQSLDEEDRVSLDQKSETDPLDSKQKQWILCSARGDYHALAKMCKQNHKLAKTKDPFTTAMHWAAKRGDENLVKLLAGVHRQLVNERSGYTPLHIAMQYRQETVYKLLVEVYDADPNCRDWSGKKPRQYLVNIDTSLSPGSYRKSVNYERSPAPVLVSDLTVSPLTKKENFLRIGSLNVRVKKTTEAFSNFLGVGATRSSAYIPKSGRDREIERRSDDGELHKSWGSADNIQKEEKTMPPPVSNKVRRRGASGRRGLSSHSRSTPSTPDQPRAHIGVAEEADSDSDTAAGFHTAWKQRASNCT